MERPVGHRTRARRHAMVAAYLLVLFASRSVGAQGGPYVGLAAGWDRAAADYTKGIGLDVPPATYRTATGNG